MPRNFDVIVIGAGVAGSAAAYQLAETNDVLVLEQFEFLHKLGSSHGGSRIFRHAYEEVRYVELALAADALWEKLEHDADDKLLYRTGGLDLSKEGFEELTLVQRALKEAGRPFETLSPAEVSKRFPAFQIPADNVAVYQQDAGVLAATRCVNAMLRLAAARGASLHDSEPIHKVVLRDDFVEVTTAKGAYRADKLVVTAGAWLGRVLGDLALPLHVEQQQVIYLRVTQASDFAPKRMPLFINRDPDATVYGFPLLDYPHAIKVSDHAGAPTITLEERQTELMRARAQQTTHRVQSFLPAVTNELVHYELCLYTKTPDEHFVLDVHPEHPNVVVGGGFSGHGFKFGSVLGEIIKELVQDGKSRHDLSLFSLERFAAQTAG